MASYRGALKALALCTVLIGAGAAKADGFTYSNFNTTPGLTLKGSTAATGGVLRLVPSSGSQNGAAYNTNAFTLGASDTFSTEFQFRMSNGGGIDPADGFTFVLAADPTGLGGAGFGLGYDGVPNSVAIEFDTYYNGPGSVAGNGAGTSDIDSDGNHSSNHIAIDLDGVLTNTQLTDPYGVWSCAFTTGTPAGTGNNAPGCMSNGQTWTADISYDGALLNVSVRDPSEGASFTVLSNYSLDITSHLHTNQAYVGFTSGTGAGWQDTDILSWRFANTSTLPPGVPEPASWALLIAGFGLAGATLRRRSGPVAAR